MGTLETKVDVTEIASNSSLDAITVFWQNCGPNKGAVTITCWGSAWTCYFGAMGANSIQEFFAAAYTDYLVGKLGNAQWLKPSKRHEAYLGRLIEAIKAELKLESL